LRRRCHVENLSAGFRPSHPLSTGAADTAYKSQFLPASRPSQVLSLDSSGVANLVTLVETQLWATEAHLPWDLSYFLVSEPLFEWDLSYVEREVRAHCLPETRFGNLTR